MWERHSFYHHLSQSFALTGNTLQRHTYILFISMGMMNSWEISSQRSPGAKGYYAHCFGNYCQTASIVVTPASTHTSNVKGFLSTFFNWDFLSFALSFFNANANVESRDPWVQPCLPKSEALSLNSQSPQKSRTQWHASKPSVPRMGREVETGRSPGPVGQLAWHVQQKKKKNKQQRNLVLNRL